MKADAYQFLCNTYCEETDLDVLCDYYKGRAWEAIVYQSFLLSVGMTEKHLNECRQVS